MTDEPYVPPAKADWHGDTVKVLANDRHVSDEEAAAAAVSHRRKPPEVVPEADLDFDSGAG